MSIVALAEKLSSIQPSDLSGQVADAARQRLFDALACYVAGAATPAGVLMHRLLEGGDSTENSVRCTAGTIRSTELDDIHIPSCTTIGSIVVPAALFAGAERQSTDQDLIGALAAGYEAMARLGSAIDGAGVIYDGVWTSYLCAPFAAAAAVARLWRLNPDQTAQAMAIAASRSTGVNARGAGPHSSRWYMAGCAAAEGYLAARAGELGLMGDTNVLEQAWPRAAGIVFEADEFAADADWQITNIDVKPYRTARQSLAATEAFLTLLGRRSRHDVASVHIQVPAQVKSMVDNPTFPFGLQVQLGLDRASLLDVNHRRPPDLTFTTRVTVSDNQRLTSLYPKQWGAQVQLAWLDGTTSELELLDPPGSARQPLSWTDLIRKHQAVAAASGLSDAWLEPAYNLCRTLGANDCDSHSQELAALIR